ncbi:MAG: DivIVA domain-containing protein [Gemmatimonadota bacterium]
MIDLTPLEVRQKKGDFRRSLRGYDVELVNDFLDLTADRMEELVRQHMALRETLEATRSELEEYRAKERSLSDAVLAAEKLREDARTHAEKEGDLIVREARLEADRARHEAKRQASREEDALRQVRARRAHLVQSFRRLLERELAELAVIEETLELKAESIPSLDSDAAAEPVDETGADGAEGAEGGDGDTEAAESPTGFDALDIPDEPTPDATDPADEPTELDEPARHAAVGLSLASGPYGPAASTEAGPSSAEPSDPERVEETAEPDAPVEGADSESDTRGPGVGKWVERSVVDRARPAASPNPHRPDSPETPPEQVHEEPAEEGDPESEEDLHDDWLSSLIDERGGGSGT